MDIFSHSKIKFIRQNIQKNSKYGYLWYGVGDNNNNITLVIQNQDLMGTVRIGREMYKIESLGSGVHVIIKINALAFPSEEPPETAPSGLQRKNQGFEAPVKIERKFEKGFSTNSVKSYPTTSIEVLVAYTPSAAQASGNISGLIQLAIAEANQSYINSNISIRLLLDHIMQVNYTESGDFETDLNRFMGTTDGYMDSVHIFRNAYGADVCVLIINNSDYCGIAAVYRGKCKQCILCCTLRLRNWLLFICT